MAERSLREDLGWAAHNLIAHPVSEICYWLGYATASDRFDRFGEWLHEATVPDHEEGTGRG